MSENKRLGKEEKVQRGDKEEKKKNSTSGPTTNFLSTEDHYT